MKASADGIGARLDDSLGNQSIDALGEGGVDTGDQLCHAFSIA
jgi:hypothetical protein